MKNTDMMTIKIQRTNVLDCIMAVNHVIWDFREEIADESTTEERKKIAQSSIDRRWMPVLEALQKQFDEQDA